MAMFQKRHYEAVAQLFKDRTPNRYVNDDAHAHHDSLIEKFADMFERDNPQFQRDRFFEACEQKEKEGV